MLLKVFGQSMLVLIKSREKIHESKNKMEFQPLNIAILTISDTRSEADDKSGDTLVSLLTNAGHCLAKRSIVKDEITLIADKFSEWSKNPEIDVIISTGGTGLTRRDVTPEALALVAEKNIPGFGELFRWISYQNIGTSTIQSRADAAITNGTYIFILPGSPGACRDGWEGILADQLDIRHKPCNFTELIGRLK